ncbi:MAG: ABC transporter ATP-binding protein [Candidatus Eremiobacteraeota bacterium]|nr:ABC transporter ATP-binding protein [Candidatus Eremiobacteraeota bacterium]
MSEKAETLTVYRRLFAFAGREKWKLLGGLLLGGLSSLATVSYAKAAQYAIIAIEDRSVQLLGLHRIQVLGLAILGIFVLSLIKNAAQYGGGYLMTSVGQQVLAKLRLAFFSRVEYLPLRVFDQWRAGELMSRFSNDGGLLVVGVMQFPLFVQAVITLVFGIPVMFYLDWKLTLLIILTGAVVALAVSRFSSLLRSFTQHSLMKTADLNAMLQESLDSMRVIKAFSREPHEIQRFSERNDSFLGAALKLAQISITQTPVVDFIVTLGIIVILGASAYEIVLGIKRPDQVVQFLALVLVASNPINQLSNYYVDLNKARVAAQRVFEVLDLPIEEPDAPGAQELISPRGAVAFEDLHFAYVPGHEVLRGVTADVKPDNVVALVGPSGAGKTTLVNLIPRFYSATSGALRVDGINVNDLKLASLREIIAIVPQDPLLFSDTIERNIRYGKLDATPAEVEAAARAANAHQFIVEFPEGYNTLVGARGVRLSGGERQRVSIARALLRDPRILILDEATSSLDSESEALISEALGRLFVGRTTFIIAHRLSTIRRATLILVIDRGRVVETGTHSELLARGGLYASLHERQSLEPVRTA